jgi:hypothetical protein
MVATPGSDNMTTLYPMYPVLCLGGAVREKGERKNVSALAYISFALYIDSGLQAP